MPLTISEAISADALSGKVFLQSASGPACFLCFRLGDKVCRKPSILMNIQRNVFFAGIAAVLRKKFFFRRFITGCRFF